MVRPTINSEKHIIQMGFDNVSIGEVLVTNLIVAVATPSGGVSNQVRLGAVVKAIFVEMWLLGDGNANGTSIATVEKLVSGQSPATAADMIDLDGYANKKNILFTHQGLTSEMNANAVPILREWIKIPKGKQRFGQGDSLVISLHSVVDGFNRCGLAIFKEYF